jgi:hypothetical protein
MLHNNEHERRRVHLHTKARALLLPLVGYHLAVIRQRAGANQFDIASEIRHGVGSLRVRSEGSHQVRPFPLSVIRSLSPTTMRSRLVRGGACRFCDLFGSTNMPLTLVGSLVGAAHPAHDVHVVRPHGAAVLLCARTEPRLDHRASRLRVSSTSPAR